MTRATSSMSASPTIERMWIEDMIMHHEGALQMAQSVLALNPRAEIKTFAENIIRTQSAEISLMKEILGGDKHADMHH